MKDQKGMVPIAIVLVTVVILGAVGYLVTSKNKTGTNPLSQLKVGRLTLNGNCDLKDTDLCKYINRAMTGDYFKNGIVMTTMTIDKDGKTSESIFELDGKENSRMISSQDKKETMALVHLGEFTYMKDLSDGKWWKYENKSQNPNPQSQNPEDIKEQMKKYTQEYKDKTSYKKIGKEACGKLTCFKYQMVLSDMPDYVQYIYFDDREYLMRKTRTEDKSGLVTETSYEYKSVNIAKPSPVKEGNPWGGAMDNNSPENPGSGISQQELKDIQEKIQNQMQQPEETAEPSE